MSEPPDPSPQPDSNGDGNRKKTARYVEREGTRPGDRRIRVLRSPDLLVQEGDRTFLRSRRGPKHTRIGRWLLQSPAEDAQGAYEHEQTAKKHRWWQVMCLTGLDYFSTLGYQPGIAALAAGALAPMATLILVILTLVGAYPIYSIVAARSPHGEGSIAMLERLLDWWQGKLFVLALLGFAATDFIITITLSSADATAHIRENPYWPDALAGQQVLITIALIAVLCGVFLKGFTEAISIAVVLVITYLALNIVVIGVSLMHVLDHPTLVNDWWSRLTTEHANPIMMVAVALILFPRLALGLSGFETGVAVMPLVEGDPGDTETNPAGRIRNTRKLLRSAALIMSFFLITSSIATIVLIPEAEFEANGEANGRALAFLAHEYLGNGFGTVYDISTILILWFAGASAMAGLLNIVPRYLPRYGMAPDWARTIRPLVIVFTVIAFVVTLWFRADVDAQGGAYATGVLVLMSSAAIAVFLSMLRHQSKVRQVIFGSIMVVFVYTTIVNVFERPDGVKIASFFIGAIVFTSLISRVFRATELRVDEVVLDSTAERLLMEAASHGSVRLIANHPDARTARAYLLKLREQRADHHLPGGSAPLFLEVEIADASEFAPTLTVHGEEVGEYRVLQVRAAAVPNAIAAFSLYARDRTGTIPHVYFGWTEGNPLKYLARFILFGEGDIAPLTHEILRKAEPDPERRPAVHVG